MEAFIGLEFIQSATLIQIKLIDYFIEALVTEYQQYYLRILRGKQTKCSPVSCSPKIILPRFRILRL
jgi:hypothetical protein